MFKADILNLGLTIFTLDVFEAAPMVLECCCIGRRDVTCIVLRAQLAY
jgi:hypothetical protein